MNAPEVATESYQRLSVNISTHSAAILRQVKKDRGWSTTEAIRVAIGLLGYMEVARRMVAEDKECPERDGPEPMS